MEYNYLIDDIDLKHIVLSTLFLVSTIVEYYYKLKKTKRDSK